MHWILGNFRSAFQPIQGTENIENATIFRFDSPLDVYSIDENSIDDQN